MDIIIKEIIANWGMFGVALMIIGWLAYQNWKQNKDKESNGKKIESDIASVAMEVKSGFSTITHEFELVHQKIEAVNDKVDSVKENLNDRIDILTERVDSVADESVNKTWERTQSDNDAHIKQVRDLMLLGGEIHKTLKRYTKLANLDHIFIGSFHNGNSNLGGIPFCKFDIISECYCDEKVPHDHEFAPVYKDSDILRYGSLFSVILQNDHMLFSVIPGGQNDMHQYEDIIWRRMTGLGIHQMGVKVLFEPDGTPSGFVGGVRYDDDQIDMNELVQCGHELEHIYSINKFKMQDAD